MSLSVLPTNERDTRGHEECRECHKEEVKNFVNIDHKRLRGQRISRLQSSAKETVWTASLIDCRKSDEQRKGLSTIE